MEGRPDDAESSEPLPAPSVESGQSADSVPKPGDMLSNLRQLGRETVIYGLFAALPGLAAIIITPLLTRVLSPADYGFVATLIVIVGLLSMFSVLGLDSASGRWFYDHETRAWQRTIMSTSLWTQLVAAVLIGLGLALSAGWLAPLLSDSPNAQTAIVVASLLVPLSVFRGVVGDWLRLRHEATRAAAFLAAAAILTSVGAAVLVILTTTGIVGVFAGQVAGGLLIVIVGLVLFGRQMSPRNVSRAELPRLLRYGIPLIPAAIAMWVTASSDRVVLTLLRGETDAALFAVAALVATAMTLLTMAFRLAWGPFAFSLLSQPQAKQVFSLVLSWMSWLSVTLAVLVSALSSVAIRILATPDYYSAASAVGYLAFAEVFVILTTIFAIGANIARTTTPVAVAIFAGAAFNIVLNVLLVPRMGVDGAALGTLLSFALGAAVMWWGSQRLTPIDYRLRHVALFLVVGAVLVAIMQRIDGEVLEQTIVRLLLVLPMLALPFVARLIRPADLLARLPGYSHPH